MKRNYPVTVLSDIAQTPIMVANPAEHSEMRVRIQQQEIERLRNEVSRLTIERNILRKTAVYFARSL